MKTLRGSLNEFEDEAQSFRDIVRVLHNRRPLPKYVETDKLPDNPTDKDIFGTSDCALVLCNMYRPKFMHWVSLQRRGNTYVFFDSLGNSLESLAAKLTHNQQSLLNWRRGKRLEENRVRIQKFDVHVKTCAAHQAVRLMMRDMSNKSYIHWIKNGVVDPDASVSLLTYLELK